MPDKPDRLDELEEAWQPERPTAERTKRIVESGSPVSYPPPSTASLVRSIRSWAKANWWIVAALGATGGTMGVSRLPWGEWLGLATKAEIAAVTARVAKAEKAQRGLSVALDAGLGELRGKVGDVRDDVDALRSQFAGVDERVESVEVKPKRRR